jgi:hypothetical protein
LTAKSERRDICEQITELVRTAPQLDPVTVATLVDELHVDGTPLARAIADAIEWVAAGRVDAGVALPALAMACDTLARSTDLVALRAATEAIETLEPPADVLIAVAALSRGPRPRT